MAGYIVAYGGAPGRNDMMIDVGLATTWTLPNATAGTTYYFRVYAYNTSGMWSAPSADVSATAQGSLSSGPFSVDRSRLTFAAVRTGSTLTAATGAQSFVLTQTGQPIGWTASTNAAWLRVTPASGSGNTAMSVQLVTSAIPAAGAYDASVMISGGGSTLTVPVHLNVNLKGTTRGPFGYFDTPIDGANVSGAIPVTGWALDDVQVTKVQIFRDPAPSEVGSVYVGDAIFIAGSRPDVEGGYVNWPMNNRAGWGFMVLTNMLPDLQTGGTGGNGLFRFHAFASDAEGNVSYLGTKSVYVNNRQSPLPFGTIDTPGQGAVVSGSSYVNFGWALSPSGLIPTNGSTITVIIDGVAVGHPTFNNYRVDIATLFPGYANSNGAVGYYIINTTQLANGLHSIAWVVTDSKGNTAGIGSRYFTVLNTNGAAVTEAVQSAAAVAANMTTSGEAIGQSTQTIAEVPVENATVEVQRPAETDSTPTFVAPEWTGEVQVGSAEAEPIELRLSNQFTDTWGGTYEGYLVVGEEMRPLPAGSSLDSERGTFSWQPGAGFVGRYRLMFVRTWPEGWKTKIPVEISIGPKFDRDRDRNNRER